MSTTDQRVEEFFRRAIPIHHVLGHEWAVMWWVYRGAIIRVAIEGNEINTDLVEPDTPAMHELVDAAGPDAVLDGIVVERALS